MDTPGRPFMPRQLRLGNYCLAQVKEKCAKQPLVRFPRYSRSLQSNCNRQMPVPLQKSVQANGSTVRDLGGIACLSLYRRQRVMQQLGAAISLRTER